jgi:hypothetical protein
VMRKAPGPALKEPGRGCCRKDARKCTLAVSYWSSFLLVLPSFGRRNRYRLSRGKFLTGAFKSARAAVDAG